MPKFSNRFSVNESATFGHAKRAARAAALHAVNANERAYPHLRPAAYVTARPSLVRRYLDWFLAAMR